MQCPHCQSEKAVFQALEPISYTPTIDNWQFDRATPAALEACTFFCLECEEHVQINARHRHIKKIDPLPIIWDERVDKILANCKLHRDEGIPENVYLFLRKCNFKRIYKNTPCDKVLGILLEQKQ